MKIILLLGTILILITPVYAVDFSEHATNGTLDEQWVHLGMDSAGNYNDDPVVVADGNAPDGDGYVIEFYDRDKNYFGIAGLSATPETWLDLTLQGYVYAYATPQEGSNVQAGYIFRASPEVETHYGRVLLNFPDTGGEIKLQTYTGAWKTEIINIDDSLATEGWHQLIIDVSGEDHDQVGIFLDGIYIGTKTMSDLAPGGELEAAGTIGLSILHYNPTNVVPVYFDAIEVNPDMGPTATPEPTATPSSGIKSWDIYL